MQMNDVDYWNNRFSSDWDEKGGPAQSRFFASLLIRVLPPWIRQAFREGASVLDWGCAEGDGTSVISQSFPGARVEGNDFSTEAVRVAAARYPSIQFHAEDLLSEQHSDRRWDFIVSSNTLEHFHEPWITLEKIATSAARGVVLLLPYDEHQRIEEHHYTFSESNVRLKLDGFGLVFACTIDAESEPNTQWAGAQVCLIYLRDDDAISAALSLSEVHFGPESLVGSPARYRSKRSIEVVPPVLAEALADNASLRDEVARAMIRINELESSAYLEREQAKMRVKERDAAWSIQAALSEQVESTEQELIELRSEAIVVASRLAEAETKLKTSTELLETQRLAYQDELSMLTSQSASERLKRVALEEKLEEAVASDRALHEKLVNVSRRADSIDEELQCVLNRKKELEEMLKHSEAERVRLGDGLVKHLLPLLGNEHSWLLDRISNWTGAKRSKELWVGDERMNRFNGSRSAAAASASAGRRVLLEAGPERKALTELNAVFSTLIAHAEGLENSIETMARSSSWRLTGPARSLVAWLRGQSDREIPRPKGLAAELMQRVEEINREAARMPVARAESDQARARVLYIFTGVPFDDIGGGQRAAQLARVALARGERVVYVYAYQKWEGGHVVESNVQLSGLEHLFLDRADIASLRSSMRSGDTAVFELPHPRFLPFLRHCSAAGVQSVFEMIDAWDSSLGGDWFSEAVYAEYVAESNTVVGTAKVLRDALVTRGRPDALYLPNACNEAIFDSYRSFPPPPDVDPVKRMILYFGSLYGEWFDWAAVAKAAELNSDANIYLIGDSQGRHGMPDNVVLLGSRNIEQLPAYLAMADVAILPFKPGHISDAVSPIKVFEYLAMGVPVVSLDLPEIRGYPNVHIASSATHFAELCAQELRGLMSTDGFIMENTWAYRLDRILSPRRVSGSVSIVVLMHNNESIIRRCLDSLKLHASDFAADVIVVDNQSVDDGPRIVESEYPWVKLVRNHKNGCSSGRNLGVAEAVGDTLMFLDSDQWLTSRGCFEEALLLLDSRHDLGAVGWAAGWFADGNENFGGPIVDYLPHRGTDVAEYREEGVRTDIAYLGSGGLFVPREVFDHVGGFDEYFDPTCFEDTDFALAIKASGLSIAYRNLQGIRHQPHQTTGASADNAAYQELFRRNADYFRRKWLGRPEFFFDTSLRRN
jgi:GT2 family glycosyltransferase/glycosyltransferase involved in cell wall biosynthesis